VRRTPSGPRRYTNDGLIAVQQLEGAVDVSRLPMTLLSTARSVRLLRRLIGDLHIGLVHGNGIKAAVPAHAEGIASVYQSLIDA